MADHLHYPIDVTELWGPDGEAELGSDAHLLPADDFAPADSAQPSGNGQPAPAAERRSRGEVARVSDGRAADQSEPVRSSDLASVRTELEAAFSHQLAVAVYELMAAWKSGLATTEEHINERVTAAVDAHIGGLASSSEASFYAAVELAETVRSEVGAFRGQLAGLEGLASLPRDLRHEVARIGDLLDAPKAEPAATDGLAETLEVIRAEVSELRRELSRLRGAMEAPAGNGLTVRSA